jgi:diguanylate cyclase (GGDEF)-like protein/PAS domain S-box-containing protein
MKAIRKTKKQLVDEMVALQARISDLETIEKDSSDQAQRDFSERMSRYFPQVEYMNEAIYVIFDRKYEFVSQKFADLFGVTPEEVCAPGFDPMTLVAPESQQFLRERLREGYRGEFAAQEYEYTGIKKDGSRIECETFILFIPYKWGVAIHGMLRDISLRKRIDEALQQSRGDLQVVLNSIPTSVFYTDRDHRFIRVNRAFCKSIGLPMEEIVGKTITELFPNLPAEQLAPFFEVGEHVMSTGQSKRGFIETLPSVRGRRWIQNDRVPYRDEKGIIIGVICLAIDISDFRETEEKLWYLSFHDVLTGLYNRTYFEEEMSRRENGRQFPVSVAVIRVDDLKPINDRDGIAAGNELLKQTAKILKAFRTEDVVARIGGDEFAALLPLADGSTGEKIIMRLRDALEVHNKHSRREPLKLSFGISTGEKGCSLSEVLKQAQADMSPLQAHSPRT